MIFDEFLETNANLAKILMYNQTANLENAVSKTENE